MSLVKILLILMNSHKQVLVKHFNQIFLIFMHIFYVYLFFPEDYHRN
jgi:hypothetical protein